MAALKKWGLLVAAVGCVIVGLFSIPTNKMVYGFFYLGTGIIIATYALSKPDKEKKFALGMLFIFLLFLAIGLQTTVDGEGIYGFILLLISATIATKERRLFSKLFNLSKEKATPSEH